MADPSQLRILGDGTQSKSYIHVEDVVRAVLLCHVKTADRFQTYNVATEDYVAVQEIAELAIEGLGYSTDQVAMNFTGGKRGWAGDVPIVRLNTQRIRRLGWSSERNAKEALRASLLTMINEPRIATLETVPSVF
jgi:UDP-glucose 4-epimerase